MYGGPGMDWDIVKLVSNCEMCQINQPMQSESPNSPLEMNKQPKGQSKQANSEKNIFNNCMHFLSKWLDVIPVNHTSSKSMIKTVLQPMGICKLLVNCVIIS